MKRILSVALLSGLVVGGVLVSGCGNKRVSVTAAGSTAFAPFAEKLADIYMLSHADVNVTVQGGGSAVGIQSALSGAAQIGMADLVDLPPEAVDLTRFVVARDGISMVVNPANPINNLTSPQIRAIYNGEIHNWKDVGGEDKPITVVSREAGSGTRTSFEQIVKDVKLTNDAIIQDSNGTIRETVANDANTVGYLSHGLINEKVKAVSVDGHSCTTEEVISGTYKLVRPVFFLVKGEPTGACKSFIDYVLSPEGQTVIRDSGLIPAK